jgi:hypothetical protein
MEDKHDQRVEDLTLRIVHEDREILEQLNPIRTPETNNREILQWGRGGARRRARARPAGAVP